MQGFQLSGAAKTSSLGSLRATYIGADKTSTNLSSFGAIGTAPQPPEPLQGGFSGISGTGSSLQALRASYSSSAYSATTSAATSGPYDGDSSAYSMYASAYAEAFDGGVPSEAAFSGPWQVLRGSHQKLSTIVDADEADDAASEAADVSHYQPHPQEGNHYTPPSEGNYYTPPSLEEVDDEANNEWGHVQSVVLTYVSKGADGPKQSFDVCNSFADEHMLTGDAYHCASTGSGDNLLGPPLNRETAYGMLLGWQSQCGLTPAPRSCIFDPRSLFHIKDHSLQIRELDGLLAARFDDTVKLHRQLAFSVYHKFVKLQDQHARPQSCPRRGPHWEVMGFQGEDFITDLRGVGIVGLLHLLSFFGSYPTTTRLAMATNAQRVGQHGENGAVPLACASLNFSSLAILALREGRLSSLIRQAKSVHSAVLKLHAALFVNFVHKWRSMLDATVLAFNGILKELEAAVRRGPLQLVRGHTELVASDERGISQRFALIRVLPFEEIAPSPKPYNGRSEAMQRLLAHAQSWAADGSVDAQTAKRIMAHACEKSATSEIETIFRMICRASPQGLVITQLTAAPHELSFFLCNILGYGQLEVDRFFKLVDSNHDGRVDFDEFTRGYQFLNNYRIVHRNHETFLRKPGSVEGEQFSAEELNACELHVLDRVGACFIDSCNSCQVVVGPSEAAVFVRDCHDCTFYLLAQQLRTRRCTRCTFFLFTATEPIIEMSTELRLAPLSLAYPGLRSQVLAAGFQPDRNFWNAVFDFSSPHDPKRNWQLPSLGECSQLCIALDDSGEVPQEDINIFPSVTSAMLSALPLRSGESAGQKIQR